MAGAAKEMVEDHWRTFLSVAASNPSAAQALIEGFEARIELMADAMSEHDAGRFLEQVDAERERMLDAYDENPAALKQRLGLASSTQRSKPRSDVQSLVVRTAVRATVWESVRALFRMAR